MCVCVCEREREREREKFIDNQEVTEVRESERGREGAAAELLGLPPPLAELVEMLHREGTGNGNEIGIINTNFISFSSNSV